MEQPKLEKIDTGQIIKNYKELCNILEIKQKTGKSKIIQLDKLKEMVEYHKEGNKFVIDKMLNPEGRFVDRRTEGNASKTCIEIGDVILHMLLEEYRGEQLVVTPTELLYRLLLITDDYKQFLFDTEKYQRSTGIDFKYLNSYRLKIGNQLNERIVTALNKLEKSGYILYCKQQNLVFKTEEELDDNKTYRHPLIKEDEKKLYINCKLKAFDKLNALRVLEDKPAIKDMNMVFIYGELKRFKQLSCEEISDKFKKECVNFWDAYAITTTRMALRKVIGDMKYNQNIDYIKNNFYELLEHTTENIKEEEISRLMNMYNVFYKEETEKVDWGKPTRFDSEQILYVIRNIEKMSYEFIY
ncbi:MAG: hypothetical protein ACRCX2_00300 [Paraclostridium sp.]